MIATSPRQIKIALMGPSGAGKTHALHVLTDKEGKVNRTVGAEVTNHQLTTSRGEDVKINLWDCAGAKAYERLVAIHIQRSDAILVFYSPYKAESFEEAKGWLQLIAERKFPKDKVWVVRSFRNDEDYRVQEQGKRYFESIGYHHVDLNDWVKEDIAKLVKEVAETVQPPIKVEEETPAKFEGINFGDVVFDADWLRKYIDVLQEEEKATAATRPKEETEKLNEKRKEVFTTYEKKYSHLGERLPPARHEDLKGKCPFDHSVVPFWTVAAAAVAATAYSFLHTKL